MTAEATPAAAAQSKSFSRFLPIIARILMGIAFTTFGLNGFLQFIPQPKTPMPEGAVQFSTALMKSGYLFQMVMGTQLLVGILLLWRLGDWFFKRRSAAGAKLSPQHVPANPAQ